MGKLIAGAFSGWRNKVGNVVGTVWRGIEVIKQLAIPSNPNTQAQQNQRTSFRLAAQMARWMYNAVILPYYNVAQSGSTIPGWSMYVRKMLYGMRRLLLFPTKSFIMLSDGTYLEGEMDDGIRVTSGKLEWVPSVQVEDIGFEILVYVQNEPDSAPYLSKTITDTAGTQLDILTAGEYTAILGKYSASILMKKSTVVDPRTDYSATYCIQASETLINLVVNTSKPA